MLNKHMSRQAYVNKDIPITEIRRVKRDLQKFVDLYEKVTFIEELYCDETVKSEMERRGKTPQTGYKWLKTWGMMRVLTACLERRVPEEFPNCPIISWRFWKTTLSLRDCQAFLRLNKKFKKNLMLLILKGTCVDWFLIWVFWILSIPTKSSNYLPILFYVHFSFS